MRNVCVLVLVFFSMLLSTNAQIGDLPEGDRTVRTFVLGKLVEIVPARTNQAADFETVSIIFGGKLIKQFAGQNIISPQIIASYGGDYQENYLLYRTDMGSGVCASGSVYVIKFDYKLIGQSATVEVMVSPVITGCLGELPFVKFDAAAEEGFLISVAGHNINGEYLNRWVPERISRPAPKKRKGRK